MLWWGYVCKRVRASHREIILARVIYTRTTSTVAERLRGESTLWSGRRLSDRAHSGSWCILTCPMAWTFFFFFLSSLCMCIALSYILSPVLTALSNGPPPLSLFLSHNAEYFLLFITRDYFLYIYFFFFSFILLRLSWSPSLMYLNFFIYNV